MLAACLWGGTRTLAFHRSAAALWGLASMEPSVIEISTPRFLRSWSVVVHRATAGETQEVVAKKRGIPLTGVDQTLFDLGGVIPLHHLEVVFDDALNRRLTTLPSLESTVNAQARSGKLGSGALRKLIESRSELAAIPESALETKLPDYCRQPTFRFRSPSTKSGMPAALWREWTSRIRISSCDRGGRLPTSFEP